VGPHPAAVGVGPGKRARDGGKPRRGVVLSLVASVATSYLQLRSLDYQREIAQRTLATYAESVRLFELQFKYGQISQLTLEQARSQYETAAARSRRSSATSR